MIYNCRIDRSLPRGILYNADTGERIPLVYFFDCEAGIYSSYVPDANGKPQLDPDDPTGLRTGGGCCNLKFVPFDENGQAPFTPVRRES